MQAREFFRRLHNVSDEAVVMVLQEGMPPLTVVDIEEEENEVGPPTLWIKTEEI